MPWTQTTWSFLPATGTVPVSGTDATLSGSAPFLRFTDTTVGHEDYRLLVDVDIWSLQWLSGIGPDIWTNVLSTTDPAAANPALESNGFRLDLRNFSAVAGTNLVRGFVGAEANPRWRIENSGLFAWGAGGGSATDVSLDRDAASHLRVTGVISMTGATSAASDLGTKTYIDAADVLRLPLAGGTMTGFIILNADPTAALHPVTLQYFNARVPAGGAVARSGDTMTGTLSFDFAVNGTALQARVATEANPRWRVSTSGVMEWGAGGAAAPNITLQRGADNRLDLLDALRITGDTGVGIDFTTTNTVDIGRTAANQPRDIYTGRQFLGPFGSAGTPSFTFDTDSDTGMFRQAANTLGFSAAGTEEFRVTTSLLTVKDGLNLALGTATGTQFGTATTQRIGFFGTTAVVQQVSAANLTNNVTAGGVDNTIANFTDLAVYANDAATIRNDIYQLARKLKQVNDALRLYGLLS